MFKICQELPENEKVNDIFPKAEFKHKMKRKQKKFKVKQIKTERYKKSAVPHITKRRRIVKETD
jgi:hypothetical protein